VGRRRHPKCAEPGLKDALRLLEEAGIPAINLEDHTGRPVDAVKVGTVKRAKFFESNAPSADPAISNSSNVTGRLAFAYS
jgi:hypothetical protein